MFITLSEHFCNLKTWSRVSTCSMLSLNVGHYHVVASICPVICVHYMMGHSASHSGNLIGLKAIHLCNYSRIFVNKLQKATVYLGPNIQPIVFRLFIPVGLPAQGINSGQTFSSDKSVYPFEKLTIFEIYTAQGINTYHMI